MNMIVSCIFILRTYCIWYVRYDYAQRCEDTVSIDFYYYYYYIHRHARLRFQMKAKREEVAVHNLETICQIGGGGGGRGQLLIPYSLPSFGWWDVRVFILGCGFVFPDCRTIPITGSQDCHLHHPRSCCAGKRSLQIPTPSSSHPHACLFVCWLVAQRPSNIQVYLRDGSAQTILRAAALR